MRLIDADALLEELKVCDFVVSSIIGDGDTLLFEDDVIKRIKGMPTAERVGKWIDEGTNYSCSECHRGCWVNSDYCPWCGARMIEGKDEKY